MTGQIFHEVRRSRLGDLLLSIAGWVARWTGRDGCVGSGEGALGYGWEVEVYDCDVFVGWGCGCGELL